jgi:hypothetical protein
MQRKKITTPPSAATQIYGMFIAAMQQHRSNQLCASERTKCLGAAAWAIDSNCGRRFIALVFYPGLLFSQDQEKQSVSLAALCSLVRKHGRKQQRQKF